MDGNKEKRAALTAAAQQFGAALEYVADAQSRAANASLEAERAARDFLELWREMLAEPEEEGAREVPAFAAENLRGE